MEQKTQKTTKTVQAMIAGLTCTALATSTIAPSFAAPARLPSLAQTNGITAMPLLLQTQQAGTGGQTGGTAGTGGGATGGTGGGSAGGTAGNDDDTGVGAGGNDITRSNGSSGGPRPRIYYFINSNATDRISDELSKALGACNPERLERRYRIDCLRLHFWRLSRELPDSGEYAPVRAALAKAAADLDAIVRQNLDNSAPRVRVRVNGKSAAPLLPPIRAVRPGTEAKVAKQAERVIAEATTALLRSTENSDRRMVHYQQIAAAISSTKVLLRSA
ncbi:MAG: hypothetical protein WBB85_15090 [Albidovulum sp.]|uniref:hypothetical protein n=1 Tax=Albidovulum sp. TaxID=1872424 RepID=UPI003CA734AC